MRRNVLVGGMLMLVLSAGSLALARSAATAPSIAFDIDAQANVYTFSAQEGVTVAFDAGGHVFAAWESRRQESGNYGVFGRFLDRAGHPISDELRLNVASDAAQWRPSVAAGTDGAITVVWESIGQDGSLGGVVARRIDPLAQTMTEEIAVNRTLKGHQSEAAIAAGPAGHYAVAWTGPTDESGVRRIFLRVFDAELSALTDEVVLPCSTEGDARSPVVAGLQDGRWAVVWASTAAGNRPAGVHGIIVDSAGAATGGVFAVTEDSGNHVEPALAADTSGGFAVAWMTARDAEYAVSARKFDATGAPVTDVVTVSEATRAGQSGAAATFMPDGRLLVAWNAAAVHDAGATEVLGRWFTNALTPSGDVVVLSRATRGSRMMQPATGATRVCASRDGQVAIAWSGDGGGDDKTAAYVTLLGATPQPDPAPLRLTFDVQHEKESPSGADVARAAGPHIPPTFNPDDAAQDPFGGDTDPRPAGTDFGFIGVTNTGWTPPDPHSAVGPDHLVLMTNGNISFYQKDGTRTFTDLIEGAGGFWGELGATGFVFDPEVIYDELSGRFFAMAAEAFAPGNRSYVLVAVSDDSDPNGTWYKYRFETTALAGDLFDSPNIGVDDEALYITGDGFGISANYPVYTFDKASLLVGDPPAITRSTTLSTSTQSAGLPPSTLDNPPALYMIEHQEGSNRTQVRLIALRNPLGTPTFTTTQLTVPSYSDPGDPPQMGTSVRPNTFDSRFWSVEYRDGSLWATHHINSNPVKGRWYQIAMNGWPTSGQNPSLVQSGDVDLGQGVHSFFTSIAVDADGNAALCFNRSASNEFISIVRGYRLAGDPPGFMGNYEIVRTSGGGSTSGRFGDYSSIDADPAQASFWLHHEYTPSGGSSWNTWVARVDLASSVPCADVKKLKGRCKDNGTIVAKVVLFNDLHDGKRVTVAIDGVPADLTISSRRASYKPCCFTGSHTITLEDPPSCKAPVGVTCP